MDAAAFTAYGDRLANELDPLTWSEAIKLMQRNWIGRGVGAEVDFKIVPSENQKPQTETPTSVRVYTTRPDTLLA